MNVNLCKIPKVTNFTHFVPKIFHINPSKIVYIYPSVSIMYIYTVNVGLQINILFYFLSHWSELSLLPHFTLFLSISLSLSSSKEHSWSTIHPPLQPSTTRLPPLQHIIIQPKNQWKIKPKINRKSNPKSNQNSCRSCCHQCHGSLGGVFAATMREWRFGPLFMAVLQLIFAGLIVREKEFKGLFG